MTKISMSRKQAVITIFLAIAATATYKAWKYFLRNSLGLGIVDDYLLYEHLSTAFRILLTAFTIFLFIRVCKNRSQVFFKTTPRIAKILWLHLATMLIIRLYTSDIGANPFPKFFQETYMNFFVGLWEEFMFRGLLLIGITRLTNSTVGIVVSSILFSAMHYDTYPGAMKYFFLFTFGMLYSMAFLTGASLLFLAMLHFLWDLIIFGVDWGNYMNSGHLLLILFLDLVFFGLLTKEKIVRFEPD